MVRMLGLLPTIRPKGSVAVSIPPEMSTAVCYATSIKNTDADTRTRPCASVWSTPASNDV